MNPRLEQLQTYPFQKLTALLGDATPNPRLRRIALHIGEPKHPTPEFIRRALVENLDGLAVYPATLGSDALREAIGAWVRRRYRLDRLDPATQILPVNGSREALFAIAQAVVDTRRDPQPVVVAPNPFYQIYEGATILAGAVPHYLNSLASRRYGFDTDELPPEIWTRVQLMYVCSPDNPTGRVLPLEEWRKLFDLADRYDFVLAADECYSEIYFQEGKAPLGALEAAVQLGRPDFERLIVFSSLSKRSNVPGMRSGFVAGNAALLKKFLLYRTYQGSAMSPPVQAASIAAWSDEAHVIENRRLYREKFETALPILKPALDVEMPDAAFYLWARTPVADTEFTRRLYEEEAVTVLPGSYFARTARGINPGENRVRIALVSTTEECEEAAQRIARFAATLRR